MTGFATAPRMLQFLSVGEESSTCSIGVEGAYIFKGCIFKLVTALCPDSEITPKEKKIEGVVK